MIPSASCVLLAAPRCGLAEGLRGLLETVFEVVAMVADERSLLESAERLEPRLAVVEQEFGHGGLPDLLRRLRRRCPGVKVLILGTPGTANGAELAIEAGASGYLPMSHVASGLLSAVNEVLCAERRAAAQRSTAAAPGFRSR